MILSPRVSLRSTPGYAYAALSRASHDAEAMLICESDLFFVVGADEECCCGEA